MERPAVAFGSPGHVRGFDDVTPAGLARMRPAHDHDPGNGLDNAISGAYVSAVMNRVRR